MAATPVEELKHCISQYVELFLLKAHHSPTNCAFVVHTLRQICNQSNGQKRRWTMNLQRSRSIKTFPGSLLSVSAALALDVTEGAGAESLAAAHVSPKAGSLLQ